MRSLTHLLYSKGFNGFPHKHVASHHKNIYILSMSCIFHDNCIPRLLDLHRQVQVYKRKLLVAGNIIWLPTYHSWSNFVLKKEKKTLNTIVLQPSFYKRHNLREKDIHLNCQSGDCRGIGEPLALRILPQFINELLCIWVLPEYQDLGILLLPLRAHLNIQ